MKKYLRTLTITSIGFLLSGCMPLPSPGGASTSGEPEPTDTTQVPPEPTGTTTETPSGDYYASITDSMNGEELKTALYNIIHPKKCQTNYDYVWNYLWYSDVGHPETPYGKSLDDILAYYRGTIASKTDMNKEHVWPKSRGGALIEGDPHMVRPTLTSDNSDRGNSFYVEGMNSDTNGWDPKAAGMNEDYRGDCARIIFYCAVQEMNTLTLVDKDTDSASNKTMGKLSDLLKWNLQYAVQQSEKNRNDILSGKMQSYGWTFDFNRNPFIDHPEYACRIWGSTNSTTRQICGM